MRTMHRPFFMNIHELVDALAGRWCVYRLSIVRLTLVLTERHPQQARKYIFSKLNIFSKF